MLYRFSGLAGSPFDLLVSLITTSHFSWKETQIYHSSIKVIRSFFLMQSCLCGRLTRCVCYYSHPQPCLSVCFSSIHIPVVCISWLHSQFSSHSAHFFKVQGHKTHSCYTSVCRDLVVPRATICCSERNYISVTFALKDGMTDTCL